MANTLHLPKKLPRVDIRYRLKLLVFTIRYFLEQHKRGLGGLLLVLLLLGASVLFSLTARPGDLLFFPRLMLEKVAYPVTGADSVVSLNNYLNILRHRALSYNDYARSGECVKLLLADKELTVTLQEMYQFSRRHNLTEDTWRELAKVLPGITETSSCQLSPIVANYPLLAVSKAGEQTSDLRYKLEEAVEALKLRFQELKTRVHTTKLASQDVLDQLSDLLLYAERVTNTIPQQEISQTMVKMQSVDYALRQSDALLKGQSGPIPWQFPIMAICSISEQELAECETVALSGKWNSIASQSSELKKLLVGESTYLQFYQKF